MANPQIALADLVEDREFFPATILEDVDFPIWRFVINGV